MSCCCSAARWASTTPPGCGRTPPAGTRGPARPRRTPPRGASRRSSGSKPNALEEVGILRYRAELADLVENELDHLLVTEISIDPAPDPDEVMEWRFVPLDELDEWIARARDEEFTAWFPPAWEIVSARVRSARA